jgi:hypothetical protein
MEVGGDEGGLGRVSGKQPSYRCCESSAIDSDTRMQYRGEDGTCAAFCCIGAKRRHRRCALKPVQAVTALSGRA